MHHDTNILPFNSSVQDKPAGIVSTPKLDEQGYPILSTQDIIVSERLRKDHGDVEDFAAGIAELGHLIQPIVLNRKVEYKNGTAEKITYTLVAGGRRTKALSLLGWPLRHGIEYVFKNELTDDLALEIELAENTERLDMTWQERCLSIWRIHNLKVKVSAEAGKGWGQTETGRLIGVARSQVNIAVLIAKALADSSDSERQKWINGAVNMRDAVTRYMKWKEDEGMQHLAKNLISNVPAQSSARTEEEELDDETAAHDAELAGKTPEDILRELGESQPVTTIEVSKALFHGSCFDRMKLMADNSLDAHIITDPPYAIEMSNIQQSGAGSNMETVAAEHDVEANLEHIAKFIPEAYRVLRDNRFMVLFCDMEHFNTLIDLGKAAGFIVQRWPIVWVKTHHCQNNCAQYNFTKATEDAIVMRKGQAIMAKPPQTNWWMGDNVDVKKKHPDHPFVKPLGLWQFVAMHVAQKGQTIYDPHMGEGSAHEALLPMGFNYMGDEINEKHFSKALVGFCDFYSSIYHGKVRFV